MRVPFLEAVKQRLLLGDGAMGTQLIEPGCLSAAAALSGTSPS